MIVCSSVGCLLTERTIGVHPTGKDFRPLRVYLGECEMKLADTTAAHVWVARVGLGEAPGRIFAAEASAELAQYSPAPQARFEGQENSLVSWVPDTSQLSGRW